MTPEAMADLRRWESKALRRADRGGAPHPHQVEFESRNIPADVQSVVHSLLTGARTRESVKAAFRAAREVVSVQQGPLSSVFAEVQSLVECVAGSQTPWVEALDRELDASSREG
jgi:hypothetical protein